MNPLYPAIAERASYRCEYCRAPELVFNLEFQVEHVTPRARGGGDEPDNLALACISCNLFKSDALTGTDSQTGDDVALFHPREAIWGQHFSVDATTGELVGLTATGRATIARLRMNSARQCAGRLQWMRLGVYP